MVDAFDDEVIAEQNEEHVTNDKILTINIIINPGSGPKTETTITISLCEND